MGFPYFTPEQIEAWEATLPTEYNIPTIGKKNRCKGCGKFMPKDLETTTYINVDNEPCHMIESCMTKALNGETK